MAHKKCIVSKLVYSISQLNQHRILKILVSTPHNMGGIMGGRHKNFEDPMLVYLRNRVNKFGNYTFFSGHPLRIQSGITLTSMSN